MEAQGPQSSPSWRPRSDRKRDACLCCVAPAELGTHPCWRPLPLCQPLDGDPSPSFPVHDLCRHRHHERWRAKGPRMLAIPSAQREGGPHGTPTASAQLQCGRAPTHSSPARRSPPVTPSPGVSGKRPGPRESRREGEPRPFRVAAAGHDLTLRRAAGPQANALRWERASRCSDP